jgi:hypothetical protein
MTWSASSPLGITRISLRQNGQRSIGQRVGVLSRSGIVMQW